MAQHRCPKSWEGRMGVDGGKDLSVPNGLNA